MSAGRLAAAIALSLAAAGPAAADRILPVAEGSALMHRPAGSLGDELGPGWGLRTTFGAGWGRLALSAPLEIGRFAPRRPERDSDSLLSLGTGVEIAGVLYQGRRAGLRARGGYQWRWLSGNGTVIRRCHEVGGCDGGYWPEEPRYLLSGPSIALSATWSWAFRDNTRAGVALEARLERAHIELPGTGVVAGPLVGIGLTAWLAPSTSR